MENEYKAFEEWADSLGWFKVYSNPTGANWLSPQGNAVYLSMKTDGKLQYAETLVNRKD